jgi:hypothetical protein
VLALFPALIVMVALLGLLGEYPRTSNALLEIVGKVSPGSAVDTFRGPITGVAGAKGGAGALFGLGLAAAIWSASGVGSGAARQAGRASGRRRSHSCTHVGMEGDNHARAVRRNYVSVRVAAVAALRAAASTWSVGGLSAASSARCA